MKIYDMMIPIVLCFYHHQQIEINHGHVSIVFNNEEMELYNQIVEQAELHNISYQSAVKRIIEYYQAINGKQDKEQKDRSETIKNIFMR